MPRLLTVLLLVVATISGRVCLRAQSNDSFANRLTLTGPAPVAVSNNLRASREADEPNHAGAAGGRSLWYTWTAPMTGTVNLNTYYTGSGTSAPRAIAVYTGDAPGSLSEVASSNNQAQAYYINGYYYGYPYSLLSLGGTSVDVPVTAGTVYQIAVDALTGYRSTPDDGTVFLAIDAPPTILSAATATGTTGTGFGYTVSASGGVTAYSATGLPAGLSLNATSGQITGVPASVGTYSAALSATGPGGTGTAALLIRITDPVPVVPVVPVINSSIAARAYLGAAFSYSISASGSPTAYAATNLPAGLSLNASTGAISGTPTATGATTVPISAAGAAGTGTGTLTITVDTAPLPIITSNLAARGTTGSSFSYYIYTNLDAYSALAPTSYAATNLPPGLAFDSPTTRYFSGTPTQAGVYTVPISVTNSGGTRQATVTVTISDPVTTPTPAVTAAPVLSSRPYAFGIVGTAFSAALAASNTPTSFGASNLPAGLTFNSTSGILAGTPTAAGTFLVPVTATNAYGTSTGTLTITVSATAAAQNAAFGTVQTVIVSAASVAGYTSQSLSYPITATYNGSSYDSVSSGTYWTFSATGLPPGLSVTGSSSNYGFGAISGTPTTAGTYRATVSATCPANTNLYGGTPVHPASTGTAVVTFIVNAGPVPIAPVITGSATVSAVVGNSLSYSPSATNSPTSYAASGLPAGLSISATAGTVSGTPTAAGTSQATISATNAAGTGTATVTFIVAAQPAAPLITSGATAAGIVGSGFSYSIYTGSTITSYGAGSLPPGLTLDASSGAISGTPTQAGVYTVPISAANAAGTANATLTITISATAPSRPPTITNTAVAQATVAQDFYYYFRTDVSATSYAVNGTLPPGLSFSALDGFIYGTPTTAGTYQVPISATNAAGTGTATLTILVGNPALPVFTNACAVAGTIGQPFLWTVTASGYPTDYTVSGLPPGVTQNSVSLNYLTGTPTQAGVYTVPFTATNAGGTAQATLTITISPAVVSPPVISSRLATTGVVGVPFRYTVLASSSPTSYAVSTLPAGLQFNASTGVVSGTPTGTGTYTLNFSATNLVGTGTARVGLVVYAAPPGVPIITAQANAIAYYSEPFYLATNATNAPTSYSATNLLPGLSIDAATGVISGTPTSSSGSPSTVVTATNAAGSSQAVISFSTSSTPSAPHFTSAATTSAVVNQAFSRALACNAYVYSYSVSGLPTGLTYNSSNGVISGTPTGTGTSTVTLSASTQYGTATGKMQIVIGSSAGTRAEIVSALGVGGNLGLPLAYAVKATNSPTGYAASGLPAGLTLNSTTGVISGTPTATGTTSATLMVSNAAGSTVAPLTFTVTTTTLVEVTSAAGIAGYTDAFLSYAVTVGSSVPVGAVNVGTLPAGLSYDGTARTISGTPTRAGSQDVSLTVFRPNGTQAASALLTFNVTTVATGAPVLTSAAGASCAAGDAFTYTFGASNAPTAYAASNLPPGLAFDSAAHVISGTPTATGTYLVSLSASNANGTGTGTLTLTVTNPAAPVLTSASNTLERAFTVGTTSTTASNWYVNATGSPTSYAASGLPPGLGFNTANGQFTGTLTTVGTYPVTVSATNGTGAASAVITYVVSAPAQPLPVIASLYAGLTGFVGAPISTISLSATNSPTSYAANNLPPGLVLNTLSGQISGTPTTAGAYTVNLSATNAAGTGTAVWQVVVNNASVLYPVFSSVGAEISGTVGQNTYYGFYAYAYYGGTDTSATTAITVSGLPPGVQVSSSSSNYLQISGTPTAAGAYPLTLTATALGGATTTATCTLVVLPAPAPRISSAAGVLGNLQNAFSYYLSASNTVTSYSVGTLPPGLVLDVATGRISGIPTAIGTTAVPVSATGPYGTASAVVTFRIDPPPYGGLPVITSAATILSQEVYGSSSPYYYPYTASGTVSYNLTAFNQPASWTATNLPAGLSFNPSSGLISGVPTGTGTFQVPVTATNASGTVNATLTIVCTAYFAVPYTSLAASTYVGAAYSDQIAAYYPASNSASSSGPPYYYPSYFYDSPTTGAVAYAAAGLPPGLTINTYTGQISGTPTRAGTYAVTFATTNRAGTGRAVGTILVTSAAPPVTPAAPTVPVFSANAQAAGFMGIPLKYSLYASGTPGYAATGLPPGITLNPSTGLISGTPTVAGVWTVPVSATNAVGTTTVTLTITVEGSPATPSVGSACATTASIGVPFGYNVSVSNYPGEPVPTGYGASGLPAGLSFNAATGYLNGTPTGPTGTYTVPLTVAVGPSLTVNGVLTLTVQPAPAPTTPLLISSAGALGLTGNPFNYAVSSSAFAPTAALPAGLSYNATNGVISGYPTAAGTYVVPMAVGGSSGGSTLVRPAGRRTALSTTNGNGAPTASLTIRVINPDFSLPRLTTQPGGGSALEGGSFAFVASAVGAPAPVFQWSHNGVPLAGATGSTLEIDALETSDSGTYMLTVSNAAGSVTSNAAMLVVQTTYAHWQSAHFTSQEIAAGLAGDNVSFSGDGVPNLLKYALGLDPRAALNRLLPVTSSRSAADGRLQIDFNRDAGLTDIDYLVQASSDLRTWTTIAQSTAGAPMTGLPGSEYVAETASSSSSQRAVTVRAAPSSSGSQFMRVRISRP